MFTVTEAPSSAGVILTCSGRLDQNGGAILDEALGRLWAARHPQVVLDFGGVNFLSSAGVRSLLVALKKAKLSGGQLSLCKVTADVRQVLQLSGLEPLLPVTG